uniref:ATP synthase complex subunit 8 n=1 Tax=Smaug warreni TaxID=885424 RepID=Q6I7X0_9SAUR|nr:ATP synthase F0 subunit 8 [Smaug warreni]BAD24754.1 ATPase subunit 8 [Smaug warreni]
MPQLILNPWFLTFLFSWLIILFVFKPKAIRLTYENPRKAYEHHQKTHYWNWPWP